MKETPHDRSAATVQPSALVVVGLALVPFALRALSPLLPGNYLAQSIYKLGQFFIAVLWRRKVDGHRGLSCFWPVNEPLPSWQTIGLAVVIALATIVTAAVAIPVVASWLQFDPANIRHHLAAKFSLSPEFAIPAVVFLSTFNAGLEELHYRVWFDRVFSQRWGNIVGIVTSAAAFSAIHLFIFAGVKDAPLAAFGVLFVVLLVAGVVWSLLARRPGGIHAAWLCHGLTDAGFLTWGLWWLGYFNSAAA